MRYLRWPVSKLFIYGLVIVLLVCFAVVTEAITKRPPKYGENFSAKGDAQVKIVKQNIIRPFCRFIQRLVLDGNMKILIKTAKQLGATHVGIVATLSDNKIDITMNECPSLVNMPYAEVDMKCSQNDSNACIEIAYRAHVNNYALKYLQKSCSLKNDTGCRLAKQVENLIKKEATQQENVAEQVNAFNNTVNSCQKGVAKSCLSAASAYNQVGRVDDAIRMAELACINGSKEGCAYQSNLLQQKAYKEQQDQAFLNTALTILQLKTVNDMRTDQMIQNALTPSPQLQVPQNCVGRYNMLGTRIYMDCK